MKLTLTLIASAAYFALTLGAYAESASSQTNGVPGGTISTPGAESKGNPIPPATKPSETKQGYVIVTPPPSRRNVGPAPAIRNSLQTVRAVTQSPGKAIRDRFSGAAVARQRSRTDRSSLRQQERQRRRLRKGKTPPVPMMAPLFLPRSRIKG